MMLHFLQCFACAASICHSAATVGVRPAGLPVLLISLFGNRIQAMHPDTLSISHFAGNRFGPVMRAMVVLIALFNMSIAMLAEYTAMGSIFKGFVGTLDYPIIIITGVLTMAYTS
jgi:solute:Na+ symporter, SSS family